MTPKKRRRLAFAIALVVAGTGAAALVVFALGRNTQYFESPSDVTMKKVGAGVAFRMGGLVEMHSVHHGKGAAVDFVVTDGRAHVPVEFNGILPALFHEGRGVIAMGSMTNDGVFEASEVLAKHDERYMPPDVVDALKRSGRWKESQ